MIVTILMIQMIVFLLFFLLERLYPAREIKRANSFWLALMAVNALAVIWIQVAIYVYADLTTHGLFNLTDNPVAAGLIFYFIYSFISYWYHRLRHSTYLLWRFVHRFHHSSPQMETAIAFYKHPTEYIVNTCVILSLGWCLSMPVESIALALAIEGCLECFHHSNIKINKKLNWIGWNIQTPEMHLIHHEYGNHRYNYATFLWDTIFRTARISTEWNGKLGFDSSFDTYYHITLKK